MDEKAERLEERFINEESSLICNHKYSIRVSKGLFCFLFQEQLVEILPVCADDGLPACTCIVQKFRVS
jgi:hypothetical protein